MTIYFGNYPDRYELAVPYFDANGGSHLFHFGHAADMGFIDGYAWPLPGSNRPYKKGLRLMYLSHIFQEVLKVYPAPIQPSIVYAFDAGIIQW